MGVEWGPSDKGGCVPQCGVGAQWPGVIGPIPWGDEIREIRPLTKKNPSLGLGAILAPTNRHGRRSGGR